MDDAPKSVAEKPESEPPKLPIGVRETETIKTSFIQIQGLIYLKLGAKVMFYRLLFH